LNRLLLAACLAIASSGCGSASSAPTAEEQAAATATAAFRVTGMTCASCGVTIRTALGKVEGVAEVKVDSDVGTATVRYDPARVMPERIAAVITDAGYPATVVTAGASTGQRAASDADTVAMSDPAPVPAPRPAAWETIDPKFEGCGGGGCGTRLTGSSPDIVIQPGAQVGQRTLCLVSGAAFEVEKSSVHREVDGRPVYLCCESCAEYFDAHRDQVLALRGFAPSR
jgi:copper chaperone CopZ